VSEQRSDVVRVTRQRFKGEEYLDIRLYFKGAEGDFVPTRKGVTVRLALVPELIEGLRSLCEDGQEKNHGENKQH
jgi:hypothetical protein